MATAPVPVWNNDNQGVGGSTTTDWVSYIGPIVASDQHLLVTAVLLNLGVNDMSAGTSQAAYISNLQYVLDQVHARWPAALVYIAYPWKAGFDTQANAMAGWVDTVVASRSFARHGHDERIWLKGSDNGASETIDGVHYSVTGENLLWPLWKTILGY
jgi:lysophospholipase L1-like esterase